MGSLCLFKAGFKILMNSVSNIRQSHTFRKAGNMVSLSFVRMCLPKAVLATCSIRRLFGVGVGLYDVTSLALVSLEMEEDFLFLYKTRFFSPLALSKLF